MVLDTEVLSQSACANIYVHVMLSVLLSMNVEVKERHRCLLGVESLNELGRVLVSNYTALSLNEAMQSEVER